MKMFKKIAIGAIILLAVFLASCGGGGGSVETEGVATEESTEAHVHVTSEDPIRRKDPDCSMEGYIDYRCDECLSVFRESIPMVDHEYVLQKDEDDGFYKMICLGCRDESIPLDEEKPLEFTAFLWGEVSMELEVPEGGAEIELHIDGQPLWSRKVNEGKQELVIGEEIERGEHTFALVCIDGAASIRNLIVNGSYNRRDALILELRPATEGVGSYATFYIYVQTSDPSGKYYIRYNMAYEYNNEAWGEADSTKNIDAFRVEGANLVLVESVTETAVSYKNICRVLNGGEISLAVKESGAVDYIGGFHGDERIESFSLKADGVSYIPGEEKKVVRCSYIEWDQTTILNRCNMPGDDVLRHVQQFLIDSSGFSSQKQVEWLTDSFRLQEAFLQMFTMTRVDGEKLVCEIFETLDVNGRVLARDSVVGAVEKDTAYLSNIANRGVRYSSAESGVTAKIQFSVLDNSVLLKSARVSVRAHGDNKWYASFVSPDDQSRPRRGEVWKIETHFNIDYVAQK